MGRVGDDVTARVVSALNQEWGLIEREPSDTVGAWSDRCEQLVGAQTLAQVLTAQRRHPDPVLFALLTEAGAGDVIAARTVLQALLGGLIRLARRDQRGSIDGYVGELCCRIGGYPLRRRPTSIAANLLLDTRKAMCAEPRWLTRGTVLLVPRATDLEELARDGLAARDPAAPGWGLFGRPTDVRAAEVLRIVEQSGLLDPGTCALLGSVYVDELDGIRAARRHGSTPGSVRARCSRAVRTLSDQAVELWEAAA